MLLRVFKALKKVAEVTEKVQMVLEEVPGYLQRFHSPSKDT